MPQRYDIREDREGWTVFDLFTGEPVVISAVPQTGLEIQDADELAELLDGVTGRPSRGAGGRPSD
jgi:hypothetical protein